MAKKQATNATVLVETVSGPVEVSADARVLVIKSSKIEGVGTGDEWDHPYATTIHAKDYSLEPITLLGGATLVNAELWAAHVAANSPGLEHLEASGALAVHESVDSAHRTLGASTLRKVVDETRDGKVLRRLEQLEQDADSPRRVILQALRERLRLYRDYAPPQHLGSAALARAKGFKLPQAEARA